MAVVYNRYDGQAHKSQSEQAMDVAFRVGEWFVEPSFNTISSDDSPLAGSVYRRSQRLNTLDDSLFVPKNCG